MIILGKTKVNVIKANSKSKISTTKINRCKNTILGISGIPLIPVITDKVNSIRNKNTIWYTFIDGFGDSIKKIFVKSPFTYFFFLKIFY